jgi:carbon starvation protein
VTALPLLWDASVTLTASWMKIFSPEPTLGFFAQRGAAQEALANGELYGTAQSADDVRQIITNSTVDGVLSILFALLIIIVLVDAVRVWFGIIRGGQRPDLSEAPWEESRLDSEGQSVDEREPVGTGR